MTKSLDEAEAPKAAPQSDEKSGFVREWVVPVVLGLAIGGAVVGGYRYGKLALRSPAAKAVAPWTEGPTDPDTDDRIEKDLKALGQGARGDLLDVLSGLAPDQLDVKIRVAHLLAGEPWFATTSLKEIVADAKSAEADRRAVVAALVDVQSKEVDTELVLPVLERWLGDAQCDDRTMAVPRLEHMWREGMLNSRWEARFKTALLEAAKKVENPKEEEAERIVLDRAAALYALQLLLPDDDAKKLLWATAKDDADDELVRINSVRALAEGKILDDATVDDWAQVAKAKNGAVRQTVADNLAKSMSPAFDKVIEPLQFDENPLTRYGALDTQNKRKRPTALPRFDELLEDGEQWVRFHAMFAAGLFRHLTDGEGARAGMMIRLLESSDDPVDVMGAAVALKMIKDKQFGFQPTDVRVQEQSVDETALRTFMADVKGRKEAADAWRKEFGGTAAWTDEDRKKTLEKLLKHADEKNRERAKAELEALGKAGK